MIRYFWFAVFLFACGDNALRPLPDAAPAWDAASNLPDARSRPDDVQTIDAAINVSSDAMAANDAATLVLVDAMVSVADAASSLPDATSPDADANDCDDESDESSDEDSDEEMDEDGDEGMDEDWDEGFRHHHHRPHHGDCD